MKEIGQPPQDQASADTIPPAPQAPPTPTTPEKRKFSLLIFLLSTAFLLSLTAATYFAYQLYFAAPSEPVAQTQESSPTPTATPDETANWKTYTDSSGFSIKYPSNYELETISNRDYLNKKITWYLSPQDDLRCVGEYCPVIENSSTKQVNQRSFDYSEGWFEEVGGKNAQSYVEYGTKLPQSEAYLNFILWELPVGSPYTLGRTPQPINPQEKEGFDQIIQTFKLTEIDRAPSNITKQNWQTYTDPQYGYSLKLPPKWHLSANDTTSFPSQISSDNISSQTFTDGNSTFTIFYEWEFDHDSSPWKQESVTITPIGNKIAEHLILGMYGESLKHHILTINQFHNFRIEAAIHPVDANVFPEILKSMELN